MAAIFGPQIGERERCQYAVSRIFDLFNPGNDLYQVLRVLKRLGN